MGRIDKESDDAILSGDTDVAGATTTDGQPLKLNPGRSWIGYASANNGGKVVEK